MQDEERQELVDEFVEELFTNCDGSKAEWLLLWRDGDKRDLGGWSRAAIADRLQDFVSSLPPAPAEEATDGFGKRKHGDRS